MREAEALERREEREQAAAARRLQRAAEAGQTADRARGPGADPETTERAGGCQEDRSKLD